MPNQSMRRLGKAVLLASTAWIAFAAPSILTPALAVEGRTPKVHDVVGRLLKRVDTVTTTYSYDATGNVTSKSTTVTSPPPPNCFPAGSMVEMADGRVLPIEQVRVGDLVRGRFGEANEVLALSGTWLGDRPLYLINGEHRTTGEHVHWRDQGPLAANPSEVERARGAFQVVTLADGSQEEWRNIGLARRVDRLAVGAHALYCDGLRKIASVEICRFMTKPHTPLYDLVLGGSHTMRVDGYLVSGWAQDIDFDYDKWQPIGPRYSYERRTLRAVA